MMNRYLSMVESYKFWFPTMYERTIDCKQSGTCTLLATLTDGSKIEFNSRTTTMRDVTGLYSTTVTEMDEETWRKEFGARLRNAITTKNITQERLSDITGISRQMLTRYIRGQSTPSGYALSRLSAILDCDPREFTRFDYIEEE